jgi:hypothetical protein
LNQLQATHPLENPRAGSHTSSNLIPSGTKTKAAEEKDWQKNERQIEQTEKENHTMVVGSLLCLVIWVKSSCSPRE